MVEHLRITKVIAKFKCPEIKLVSMNQGKQLSNHLSIAVSARRKSKLSALADNLSTVSIPDSSSAPQGTSCLRINSLKVRDAELLWPARDKPKEEWSRPSPTQTFPVKLDPISQSQDRNDQP